MARQPRFTIQQALIIVLAFALAFAFVRELGGRALAILLLFVPVQIMPFLLSRWPRRRRSSVAVAFGVIMAALAFVSFVIQHLDTRY